MFRAVRDAIARQRPQAECLLPDAYTLADLASISSQEQTWTPYELVCAILLCLEHTDRISRVQSDQESINQIADFAARSILGPITGVIAGRLGEEPKSEMWGKQLPTIAAAIRLISLLCTQWCATLGNAALLCLVAHSDTRDPWTTPHIQETVLSILAKQLDRSRKTDFITNTVMQSFLKPLFSQSGSSRITTTGRRAHYGRTSVTATHKSSTLDALPSWKDKQVSSLTVFRWAIDEADELIISEQWPLFVPVLLALLDDGETQFRAKGLEALQLFLSKCHGVTLRDTGLGMVFEETLFPTLLFLPSLTPVDESLQLLELAYDALLRLVRVQFPANAEPDKRSALLDKILREGILAGYSHASDYIAIVDALARQAERIVNELGINATKHLKDLLPICFTTIADPFITSEPLCLMSMVRLLKAVIINCWPRFRIASHANETLRIVTVCWLNLHPNEEQDTAGAWADASNELVHIARLLLVLMSDTDLGGEAIVAKLVAKEPRLQLLFAGT